MRITPRWLLLLAAVALAACDSEIEKLPVDKALAYQIVAKEDRSVDEPNFKRTIRRVSIHAKATTIEERVHTALKAAIDVQKEEGVDYVETYLLISPHPALVGTGKYVALARYALDGMDDSTSKVRFNRGTWDVRASDVTPSELEIKITELWFANREQFAYVNRIGMAQVKIPEMQAFISKELNIPPKKVVMNQWQVYTWRPRPK